MGRPLRSRIGAPLERYTSDEMWATPQTSRIDLGARMVMTIRWRRRFWISAIWLVLVAGIAAGLFFWPSVENLDDYTTWPMFRVLHFAVTALPILILLLVIALWMAGKWSDEP